LLRAVEVTGVVKIPETVNYEGTVYNVTDIGEAAFLEQKKMTSVTIPSTVKNIGKAAFLYCSGLTDITIGDGVTSIGCCAFVNCKSLTNVTVEWNTPLKDVNINAFNGLRTSTITLHTPDGTGTTYQDAVVWKEFKVKNYIKSNSNESIKNDLSSAVITNNVLRINSPVSESIFVYSISGALLYQTQKSAGEATFNINQLPQGVLIVKGSSGWVTKTMKSVK
jgi:hypothetical protein